MVGTHWYDLGIFAVINVMATKESDGRALGNEDHIPTSSKLNEAYQERG